ncbi:PREDICTED: nucleotide exchange factor SIL1-like [Branchiostoma belcheri]|uniref:Nucleotide exchange factor SIL1 n=1 Tax=Branchiostoma belcheri TaxID=7741 RepID=A0A6P4Y349_BRABE|nr:PREDICTED: nucleotide exchange factor SIL1-like [Branchiostoma belcheri]
MNRMKKLAAVHIASVLALVLSSLLLHGGNTQDADQGLQNSKQTWGGHTGALTVVPNEEENGVESDDGVVSVDVDDYDEEDLEVFYPTKEWQQIKPGQAIPAGLHVSIDLTTGEKRAKLMEEEDTKDEQDSSSRYMKWTDGDRQGMVNTKNKYFTASELKEALKKFKADQDDVSEAGQQKLREVKDQYRSYDELKEIFQQMQVDVETDTEIMQKLLLAYTEEGVSDDMRLHVLTELEYHVHQIDNAQNLIELGGFQLVILALNDSNSDIRSEAARVLGAAVQSNPKVQIEALESGAIPTLIRLVASDSSVAVRKKSLYALSSLIRHFPLAQLRFLQQGGLSCLARLFGDPDATTLRIKAVTLLHDLMVEQNNAEYLSSDNPTNMEKKNQYEKVPLLQMLVEAGWCQLIPTLLDSPDHDTREKVLRAMITLYTPCQSDYKSAETEEHLSVLRGEYQALVVEEKQEDSGDGYFSLLLSLVDEISTKMSS